MKTHRPERIASLIRKELDKLLLRELEFQPALLTITAVTVSKKLEEAAVKISVLPGAVAPAVLEIIEKERPRLQQMLFKKINIRSMPRLRFQIDRGPEKAAQVEKSLLKENTK